MMSRGVQGRYPELCASVHVCVWLGRGSPLPLWNRRLTNQCRHPLLWAQVLGVFENYHVEIHLLFWNSGGVA